VSFLLDTNVVSETRKTRPDPSVISWLRSTAPDRLFVSVLVVGEIRQGIERLARRDAKQAAALETWLTELVQGYGDRIVPVTIDIAEAWGRLNVPDRRPIIDGLQAATALVHGWTLVTRNAGDVASTGVRLLNPFTSG
jgi:predicted nucleic acid-binding protein